MWDDGQTCGVLPHPSNQSKNATKRLLVRDPPLVSHTHLIGYVGRVLAL